MKNFFIATLGLWASLSAALPTATSPNEASLAVRDLEARARPACGRSVVDKFLFKTSMKNFLAARKDGLKNKGPKCGWGSNGCTGAPNKIPILKFNFKPACDRHDFGYGNYKRLNLRKESHRVTIDNQFLKDLLGECKKYGFIKKTACGLAAAEYYKWVRGLGWIFNRDAEAVEESTHWERDDLHERDLPAQDIAKRDESGPENDEDENSVSDDDVKEFIKEFGLSLD